jgi:glycerol kinase
MIADGAAPLETLRVDGGMVANDWLLQTLADILAVPVERPQVSETTALGAACLAGLREGMFTGLDDIAAAWQSAGRFEPRGDPGEREARYAGWRDAVSRVRHKG